MADKFTGADAALADLEKLERGARAHFAQALAEAVRANDLPRVHEATPEDKGDLRESLRVEGPTIEGNVITVAVAAGGGEVDYALYVHEDMEARHIEGGAKFIEKPLKDSVPVKPGEIAAHINLDQVLGR